MTQPFNAILFDKDGTLFDFASTWEAWAQSFVRRLAEDENHARQIGAAIGFDTTTSKFSAHSIAIAGTQYEIAMALEPHLSKMSTPQVVQLLNEEAAKAPQAEAVPLAPLLDELRAQGYALGVATNDAEAPARAHLQSAGITDRFDFIAGYDSGHGGKPAPGQLLAFAAQVNQRPEKCIMVGDSRHDLSAGRAAGFATVGVLTGFATQRELADLADTILPDIGHLPAWLAGLSA